VSANAGVGYAMPHLVVKAINFFLRALNLGEIKGEGGFDTPQQTLLNKHDSIPDNCA